MTSRPLFFTSGIATAVGITTTAETVMASCGGVVTRYAGQTFKLFGHAVITAGSTTTGITMRIRRLSLTGTLVSDATAQSVITAAGDTNDYPVSATDSPGEVTGYTYVLTAQQAVGGTGGTSVYAVLECRVD